MPPAQVVNNTAILIFELFIYLFIGARNAPTVQVTTGYYCSLQRIRSTNPITRLFLCPSYWWLVLYPTERVIPSPSPSSSLFSCSLGGIIDAIVQPTGLPTSYGLHSLYPLGRWVVNPNQAGETLAVAIPMADHLMAVEGPLSMAPATETATVMATVECLLRSLVPWSTSSP